MSAQIQSSGSVGGQVGSIVDRQLVGPPRLGGGLRVGALRQGDSGQQQVGQDSREQARRSRGLSSSGVQP